MAQSHTYSISISKHGAAVVDEETRDPITMPQYDALLAKLIARRADHAAECARHRRWLPARMGRHHK